MKLEANRAGILRRMPIFFLKEQYNHFINED